MTEDDTLLYQDLVDEIQRLVEPDRPIYAAPDCPEVYFLADRPNPGRGLFDVLMDPRTRTREYLRQLDDWDVQLVVVNRRPEFSDPFPTEFLQALEERYRDRRAIGDKFLIFTRK